MELTRMLTTKQAAVQFQVSHVTVQRWLHDGKLRGVRVGGTRMGWRVSQAEVLRLLRVRNGEDDGDDA